LTTAQPEHIGLTEARTFIPLAAETAVVGSRVALEREAGTGDPLSRVESSRVVLLSMERNIVVKAQIKKR
jgi:hypothetical protein